MTVTPEERLARLVAWQLEGNAQLVCTRCFGRNWSVVRVVRSRSFDSDSMSYASECYECGGETTLEWASRLAP